MGVASGGWSMSQKLGGIPRTNYDDGKFSDPDRIVITPWWECRDGGT
jgi:hypothetical protein